MLNTLQVHRLRGVAELGLVCRRGGHMLNTLQVHRLRGVAELGLVCRRGGHMSAP